MTVVHVLDAVVVVLGVLVMRSYTRMSLQLFGRPEMGWSAIRNGTARTNAAKFIRLGVSIGLTYGGAFSIIASAASSKFRPVLFGIAVGCLASSYYLLRRWTRDRV